MKKPKYMDPFCDETFKRIFGQTANKSLLIDFLNNLLVGERHITDVTYLDKERISEFAGCHSTIYDIYCETDTGEYIIVEMQNWRQKNFLQRTVFYTSQAIERQGKIQEEKAKKEKEEDGEEHEWDYQIKAVYCIAFLNFKDSRLDGRLRVDAAICDMQTGQPISTLMRFVYLQLPFFEKAQDECETFFERWIYVLRNMEVLDQLPAAFQCEAFKKLKEITDVSALSEPERQWYEHTLRAHRDAWSIYNTWKEELKAEKEKSQTALKAEKEKSQAALKAEKEKSQAALKAEKENTARNLKSLGLSTEVIQQCTGLSKQEIQVL
jgi:predicted transposase/invertase (TIGR01784 family)